MMDRVEAEALNEQALDAVRDNKLAILGDVCHELGQHPEHGLRYLHAVIAAATDTLDEISAAAKATTPTAEGVLVAADGGGPLLSLVMALVAHLKVCGKPGCIIAAGAKAHETGQLGQLLVDAYLFGWTAQVTCSELRNRLGSKN
jgi:hypothetical protein